MKQILSLICPLFILSFLAGGCKTIGNNLGDGAYHGWSNDSVFEVIPIFFNNNICALNILKYTINADGTKDTIISLSSLIWYVEDSVIKFKPRTPELVKDVKKWRSVMVDKKEKIIMDSVKNRNSTIPRIEIHFIPNKNK